jgi:hypothetical protein
MTNDLAHHVALATEAKKKHGRRGPRRQASEAEKMRSLGISARASGFPLEDFVAMVREGKRPCSRCRAVLAHTREFFGPMNEGLFGLDSRCRACVLTTQRARPKLRSEVHIRASMIQRCHSPNCRGFKHYGGRGITVCERWRKSLKAFLADMGPRPSTKHSLDRINNDGNYEPGNCRWATQREQMANTRVTRLLNHNGETLCVKEWARRIGLTHSAVQFRLARGLSVAEALSPTRKRVVGERASAAKLTEDIVRSMRAARAGGEAVASIARRFGVCHRTASDAANGRSWRHVK